MRRHAIALPRSWSLVSNLTRSRAALKQAQPNLFPHWECSSNFCVISLGQWVHRCHDELTDLMYIYTCVSLPFYFYISKHYHQSFSNSPDLQFSKSPFPPSIFSTMAVKISYYAYGMYFFTICRPLFSIWIMRPQAPSFSLASRPKKPP